MCACHSVPFPTRPAPLNTRSVQGAVARPRSCPTEEGESVIQRGCCVCPTCQGGAHSGCIPRGPNPPCTLGPHTLGAPGPPPPTGTHLSPPIGPGQSPPPGAPPTPHSPGSELREPCLLPARLQRSRITSHIQSNKHPNFRACPPTISGGNNVVPLQRGVHGPTRSQSRQVLGPQPLFRDRPSEPRAQLSPRSRAL